MGLTRISWAARRILPRMVAARLARGSPCDGGSGGDRRRSGPRGNSRRRAHQSLSDQSGHQYPARRRSARRTKAFQGERGYLPKVSVCGNVAVAHRTGNQIIPELRRRSIRTPAVSSRGYGVRPNETVFNGNQTINSIRQAEIAGVRRARTVAQHRAEHSAFRRHGLHGRAARHRDPRPRSQQRSGPAGAAARDPGPLYRRRGHPNRRRAGGGEPLERAGDRAERGSDAGSLDRALPPGDRRSADKPRAGQADREAAAEDLARGGINLAGRASGDHGACCTESTRRSCKSRSPRARSTRQSA